ncbi:MAG: TniB family NTP-binding protein [Methylovirgula sp.]|uniref:TniB family NTP-binding protein n=1 Tax=Methylovirgula sp. TaxID=1978224 RepID=UPI0030763550
MNMHTSKKNVRLTFSEMTNQERLAHLGGFQADTAQFLDAKASVMRLYRGWQTMPDGHLLVLGGDSGVGKTRVIDDIIQDLEAEWKGIVTDGVNVITEPQGPLPPTVGVTKEGPSGLVRPVLKVLVEPKARARGFLRDTLKALGVRSGTHDTFGELMERLQVHVVGQQVRLLVLDEVHHVVEGHGPTTAYEAVEVIKMLLLQARVQIVCVGLPVAETIVDRNPELPRHCRGRIKMAPFPAEFGARADYMRFLKTLAWELPFDIAPNITDADTALRIHMATGGFIGHITNLLHAASEIAIERDFEGIPKTLLAEVYGRISGVPASENPLALDIVDDAAVARIRKRWGDRRKVGDETIRDDKTSTKPKKTKPDFSKR